MNKKTERQSNGLSRGEGTLENEALNLKVDKIISQLDLCMNILLEILFSNPQYDVEVPYTHKIAYLKSQGIESSGDISRIVGRPSNWVSTRIRESETRKSPRRKRRKNLTSQSATVKHDKGTWDTPHQ